MKKNYNFLSKLKSIVTRLVLLAFFLNLSTWAYSQCNNTSAFATATAPTTGTVTISTCSFQTEYSTINAVAAATLYSCDIASGGFITIREGTPGGPVIASGVSPLTWASTVAGTYYAHWNTNAACGTATNCVVTTITYISPATACTNPISAGTTVSNPTSACPSQNITLNLNGATVGTGLSYQWQSAAASTGPWTNVVGANTASLTTQIAVATWFRCEVICSSGTPVYSTPVEVLVNSFVNCYCTSSATSGADEEIFNVTFGSLNNSSTCGSTGGPGSVLNMYSNYTNLAPQTYFTGFSYPLSIQIGTCGGNFGNWTKAWIDYNQNGVFTDPGEEIFTNAASATGPNTQTATVTIPTTATPGTTRMRVVNVETTLSTGVNPCGTYTWGETEDYFVTIINPVQCSTIAAGTATSSAPAVCPTENFNLTLSGYTLALSVEIQWQSSTSATGPWTNIVGGTTASLAISQTSDTYYRSRVTCTNGPLVDSSNVVFVSTFSNLPAGIYTIGPAGNYPNFTAAVAAMSCGIAGPVTFNVIPNSGPYNEQITIGQILNTSAINTVTFNCNNNTVSFAPTATSRHLLLLNGTDYFTFNDLNLVGTDAVNGYGIQLTNNANFNTFVNVSIDLSATYANTGTANSGIVISGNLTNPTAAGASGSDNSFIGCNVKGGYYSMSLMGASTTSFSQNNLVSNCVFEEYYLYGIYTGYSASSQYLNNEFRRPTRATIGTFYGIYHWGGGSNNLIEGNKIHTPFGGVAATNTTGFYGIYHAVDAVLGQENKVYNNLIYNVNNSGLLYAIYNIGSDNIQYYHNTISLDFPNSTAGTTRGFFQTTAASGVDFRNNVISITRGGTGAKHCIYLGTTTTAATMNRNVYYINAPAGTNNLGFYGANVPDLTAWQAVNSGVYDQNSSASNPQFVAPSSGVYAPSNGAVNDIGDSLGVVTDILGNLRSITTPDPGAYEFSPAANDAGISSLVNPPGGVAAIGTDSIKVNLTNFGSGNLFSATVSGVISNGTTTVNFGPIAFSNPGIGTNQSAVINLGAFTFVSGSYTFKAWSSSPNGSTDANILNDTLSTSICVGLSGTYTIGAAGNYPTFASAVAALSCGINGPVVFNVIPGSPAFNEQITIPVINGASATNTVTINGNGNTLSFATSISNYSVLTISGADYLTVKNLNIVPTDATYAYGVMITNSSNFVTLDSLYVNLTASNSGSSFSTCGIAVSGSLTGATTIGSNATNLTIKNSRINGGYYSVTMVGDLGLNTNNKLLNNTIENPYLYGVYCYYGNNDSIVGNDISRQNRPALTTFYGVYAFNNGVGTDISYNEVHHPFGSNPANTSAAYPIYVSSCDGSAANPIKIHNNLIHSIESNGLIYAFYNIGSDNVKYYHNTVSLDHTAATGGTTYGIYQTTAATGIESRNNIFSITRGGTGVKAIYNFITAATTFASNNNIFRFAPAAGTNNFALYNGLTNATFIDWQASNSNAFDQNSQLADPQFYSAQFYVPTNYALDNLGAPLGVSVDLFNAVRNATTPDIGAYEFGQPTNDIELVSIATAFEPCYAAGDTLKALIKNTGSNTINFATNNLTFNWSIGGAATQSGTATINAGSLAPLATMTVSLATPINISAIGLYNVSATITSSWDGLLFNNEANRAISVNPVTASANVDTVCFGNPVILSLSGFNGPIVWQKNSGNGYNNIAGGSGTNYTDTMNTTTTTTYRASYCGVFSNVLTVVPTVVASPTTQSATVCDGQSATLVASGAGLGSVSWFTTPTGGVSLTNTPTLTVTAPTTTTYYAQGNQGTSTSAIVTVGTGTTSNTGTTYPAVFGNWFWGTRSQFLYLASELTALGASAGQITSISFNVTNMNTAVPNQGYSIYIKSTPTTSLTAHEGGAFTQVFGPITVNPTLGWNTFTFPTPFNWNGSDNLVIETCFNNSSFTNNHSTEMTTNLPFTASRWFIQDAAGVCGNLTTTTSTSRPNARFEVLTGCSSPRVPATVTVNPNPTIALGTDTIVCQGSIATLDAGPGNTNYLWSNGSTTQTIQTGFAGTYGVTVTNSFNCSTTDSIIVSVNPLPVVNLGADATICSNQPITLDAGSGYTSYTWSNGSQGSLIIVNSTGNYDVTVVDTNGCVGYDIISVTVNAAPNPQLSDLDLCEGSTLVLNPGVGSTGNTFAWSNGANTSTITVNAAGTYSVTVNSNNGCSESASADITLIPVPSINIQGLEKTCFYKDLTLSVPNGFDSYVWFNGATGQSITIPANTYATGSTQSFWVTGTVDATGCTRTDTITVLFDACVGFDENQNITGFSVYPNPSNGMFNLDLNLVESQRINIEVVSMQGKMLLNETLTNASQFKKLIDISNQPSGVYFLRISGNNFTLVEKLNVR